MSERVPRPDVENTARGSEWSTQQILVLCAYVRQVEADLAECIESDELGRLAAARYSNKLAALRAKVVEVGEPWALAMAQACCRASSHGVDFYPCAFHMLPDADGDDLTALINECQG